MSLPTLEQYRAGAGKWNRTHRGVTYELSHHGVSDYSPHGTWCYYLFLRPDMFQNADDFAAFDKPARTYQMDSSDAWHQTYDYYDIPELEFHGGVTWYSKEPYIDRETGEPRECLKIGCDYGHSWDRDDGYWHGLDDVERDAKRSIDVLVERFPMNERCDYSGKMDVPSAFYTAINGRRVHVSQTDKFKDDWATWRPAEIEETSQ